MFGGTEERVTFTNSTFVAPKTKQLYWRLWFASRADGEPQSPVVVGYCSVVFRPYSVPQCHAAPSVQVGTGPVNKQHANIFPPASLRTGTATKINGSIYRNQTSQRLRDNLARLICRKFQNPARCSDIEITKLSNAPKLSLHQVLVRVVEDSSSS